VGILKTFFLVLKKKEEIMEATLNATTEPSATTAAPPPSSLPPPSQPPVVEKEERNIDPLKSIKDQIVAYDPIAGEEEEEQEQQQKQILTKKQESEALPTLKNGEKYTCYTCQTQDSYKWFKSKMEETLGKVVCKRCYHKELVEMSDKICAVRLGPFSSTRIARRIFLFKLPEDKI
jgi:hypothetical protein